MTTQVEARTRDILNAFNSADATAAHLMCDRHDPAATAFRVIDAGLVEETITFGQLADRSRRVASLLHAHGVREGDRVATLMSKDADLPAVLLGIWRLGAVYVPLFTAFAAAAVADRLEQANAVAVVTDEGQYSKVSALGCTVLLAGRPTAQPAEGVVVLREALAETEPWREPPPSGPDLPVTHMFTSGTTGKPKTVVHPLGYAAGWQSYLEFALGVDAQSVYWNAADPGWAYGLYAAIVAPLCAGLPTILFTPKFEAQSSWRVLSELGVTDFAAAPTVFRALRACSDKPALLALRRLSSAGEPLTPDVFDWAQAHWSLSIHDHFGQTEVGMCIGFPHHPEIRLTPVAGAMGRALPGWSVTALASDSDDPVGPGQVGRIALDVKGSEFITFTGYGNDRDFLSDRFTDDGQYYLTGDLATVDEAGVLRFSSRDDDVILMAGYRIGPFDVESALVSHPAVTECAVIAAPDEVRGEVIQAFVVLSPDAKASDDLVSELQDWVKNAYAAHAYPRRIEFVDALPKTPSGKIQRSVLRQNLPVSNGSAT